MHANKIGLINDGKCKSTFVDAMHTNDSDDEKKTVCNVIENFGTVMMTLLKK